MAGENQQTNPLAQNEPVDPAIQQQQTLPAPVLTDPDEIELRDALTAAQAEKAATKPADGDQTGGQAAPAPQATAVKDPADVPMIPKPRLDQALEAQRKAEQTAAYWQGQAEARAAPAPGQQPQSQGTPTAPAQTPEQRLSALDGQIDDLAKKFDDGEITMADFKKQERGLIGQQQAIREEAKPAAQAQAPAPQNNELYLETLTADLENKHPWVKVAEKVGSEADWEYLKSRAIENLTARGVDPRKGDIGKYELRKEIATLWDDLGPGLLTKRAQEKGVALPGQQSQTPAQQPAKPALSPEAKARQDALARQGQHPPNLNAMTNSGGGDAGGVPSEAAIERMTDDEIGNLPAAVRNKMRGIAA